MVDNRENDIFEKYEGTDMVFCVPSFFEIGAKAFLSCKTIQKLELPDSIVVCYLRILQESGCLSRENTRLLLERMQDAAPESIAYLVQLLQEKNAQNDFFMGLEL